ncbi:MAG: hypothetical protein LAQ30_23450 [Acidobacteriia bacterium]|nr:hypothetical protein [Terriglobia bacterium]
MRLLIELTLLAAVAARGADLPYFCVLSDDAGAWPEILSAIGLQQKPAGMARVFVARTGAAASADWIGRVDKGAVLILEGESPLAEVFGFRRGKNATRVNSITDIHNPGLRTVWEHGLELPVFELPPGARVFARERWGGAPLEAGLRRGAGGVLWVAAPPGEKGYDRFPYLLNALAEVGLDPPFRSWRLWAFFDPSYRLRVDLDYFARLWARSGISGLHVAAWHYFEPDAARDRYLEALIEACHREGITVYAWLELPHVSEKFWADHPEWREQTALLQDAELDWRKLMNLSNRDCSLAVSAGLRRLIGRFDWDGVNLAELYFESLEGIGNPARFTPMNTDVRALFRKEKGFDPIELFRSRSDEKSRRMFLDFRSELARKMQQEWLGEIEGARREKPGLDLVLTHVDDRLDSGMRDAVGADAARTLPLLDRHSFTFLIEDPATVWDVGPQRYRTIAGRYRTLTAHPDRLAIDLNIVERYQNVYPTKQQTGTELFQLAHFASTSFHRVALYFENSLLPADLKLLPSAAAGSPRLESLGRKTAVESADGVGIPWKEGAAVDGRPWPVMDSETVWLPAGAHTLEPAPQRTGVRLLRLNAALKAARVAGPGAIEFSYASESRAIAVLDRAPRRVEIDGSEERPRLAGPNTLLLPRGQHVVTIEAQP